METEANKIYSLTDIENLAKEKSLYEGYIERDNIVSGKKAIYIPLSKKAVITMPNGRTFPGVENVMIFKKGNKGYSLIPKDKWKDFGF